MTVKGSCSCPPAKDGVTVAAFSHSWAGLSLGAPRNESNLLSCWPYMHPWSPAAVTRQRTKRLQLLLP